MKRFIGVLMVVLALGTLNGFAQTNQRLTMLQATGAATDTVTNAGTAYVAKAFKGGAKVIGVQVAVTKVSGTVAGDIVLSGSLDGTNYHNLDTLTATNTAGTKYYAPFVISGSSAPYTNYKVTHTGTGTMVSILSAILLGKD